MPNQPTFVAFLESFPNLRSLELVRNLFPWSLEGHLSECHLPKLHRLKLDQTVETDVLFVVKTLEVLNVSLYSHSTPLVRSLSNLQHLEMYFVWQVDLLDAISRDGPIDGDLQTIRSLTVELREDAAFAPILGGLAYRDLYGGAGILLPILSKLTVRFRGAISPHNRTILTNTLLDVVKARHIPVQAGPGPFETLELQGPDPLEDYLNEESIVWFREHVDLRFVNIP